MVCIDINDAQNVSDTDQYQMSVTSSVNRGGEPGAASKECYIRYTNGNVPKRAVVDKIIMVQHND